MSGASPRVGRARPAVQRHEQVKGPLIWGAKRGANDIRFRPTAADSESEYLQVSVHCAYLIRPQQTRLRFTRNEQVVGSIPTGGSQPDQRKRWREDQRLCRLVAVFVAIRPKSAFPRRSAPSCASGEDTST